MTVSFLLCLIAVLFALVEAFRAYFNMPVRIHFGWLAFALWALSLILRTT